jgi:hypothetical protein
LRKYALGRVRLILSQLEFKIYSQVEIPGCSVYQNARTNHAYEYRSFGRYGINKEKYSLLNAGQKLQIPYLIIQGTNDAAVKMEEFDLLKKHFSKAKTRLF